MATFREIGQGLEDARQWAGSKIADGLDALSAPRKGPANAPKAAPKPKRPASDVIDDGVDAIKNTDKRGDGSRYLRRGGQAMAKAPFHFQKAAPKAKPDAEDAKEMAFMRKNKAPKAMIAAEKAEEPAYKCGGMVKKKAGGMVRRGYGKARGA